MAMITFREALNQAIPSKEKVVRAVKDVLYIK